MLSESVVGLLFKSINNFKTMAAEHEPSSQHRLEQGPDVVPQVTTHEVSPGSRRNFGSGFSHLLGMVYVPDTGKMFTIHFAFRTTLGEKYYYQHFTAEQSGPKGIVCTHTLRLYIGVQKGPEVTAQALVRTRNTGAVS